MEKNKQILNKKMTSYRSPHVEKVNPEDAQVVILKKQNEYIVSRRSNSRDQKTNVKHVPKMAS